MEKLITLNGVNNIVNKLVSYIKRVEAKTILEPIDCAYKDINNYTTTGIYHFKGYRHTNEDEDHLPITNYNPDGDTENIAFTLIVDTVEGYLTDTSHIPGHISQVLMLGNRKGSETKIYVRNANIQYSATDSEGEITWENWSEVVTSKTLKITDINSGLLNETTEIGLYTGVNLTTGDVFKLEVINNYVPAGERSLPNTILQTMTVVSLDGSYKELQRTKSPDTGDWTPWVRADAVVDATENNVATFDADGQVKDSGYKIGDETFGTPTQIPVREVRGTGSYNSVSGRVYGYVKDDSGYNFNHGYVFLNSIVYLEKECRTISGFISDNSNPYTVYIYATPGDTTSSTTSTIGVLLGNEDIYYLDGDLEIDPNKIATEAGVIHEIERLRTASNWGESSNINDYTKTGIYHFAGLRLNAQDNLPIDNDGENSNIAFTLIVDRVNGEYNETNTTINDIPGIISQTLFLGNRQGTETKIYVRNANIQYSETDSEGVITWETWREQVGQTFLGLLSSYDELNRVAEIGIYTGAVVDGTSTFDVFKLEVINNYSIAGENNSVLQTLTKLSVGGSNATQKRVGTWSGSNYEWGEWLAMAENPDWNQNNETAADYIKNRTHYEFVEDYKMMYDDEYEEKIQEGKQFELRKVKTVTVNNNRYYYDTSLPPEERDEYQGEVTSIPLMAIKSNGGVSNLTYFSPRISINGKTIDLTWVEKTLENVYVSSTITPDPPFDLILDEEIRVFYNFARKDQWNYNNCAYGEGFTWFMSHHVEGYGYDRGFAHHQLNTYFIDPEVFGPAPYNIDIYFEVEYELKKIDPKFLPNISGEILNWDGNSNINNYTETGIYHFAGYRRNTNDNLPITNSGENANIAFTLIVDRKNGYYNETETTINDIPGIISQTLFLGNRQGSETRMYVRNGNIQYSDTDSEGVITWEAWRELMQTTYLGVLQETHGVETLKSVTENGLYTGALVNTSTNTFDVFKLEVINNYAVSNQAGQLMGTTIPNTVLQTITIVSLDRTDKQYKRKGNSINGIYQWGEWEDCGKVATTHKRGDVVILQQRTSPGMSIGTKVISWEEFKNTHQNYAYPGNRYTQGEFPIGLVVDPAKRTFLYLRQLDGTVYSQIKNSISGMENTMYSNGIENSYQIKKKVNVNLLRHSNVDSIFYNGNGNLKQFIPSYAESAMSKQIVEDAYYGEKFYERLIELNELMQGPGYYPGILTEPTNSIATNLFYCLNSTIIEDGGAFYIGNAQGGDSPVSLWNSGYMEFFGIYFND